MRETYRKNKRYFLSRIKYEYGRDGSLELRLYLMGAGAGDAGNYTCTIPGINIPRAAVSLYLTLGTCKLIIYKVCRKINL